MVNDVDICNSFMSGQDVFKARMEAQCYEVAKYRLAVARQEGRELTNDEAAFEWIGRYADTFVFV